MKRLIYESMLVGGILAFSQLSHAQTVRWTAFPPAGSGCSSSDTQVVAFGDSISWVFDNLGVQLTGGFAPGSDNKFCAIRAGAEVAQGVYLGQLTQTLTYGVVKSRGSSGSIATNSSFFGYNVKPFQISFPQNIAIENTGAILQQNRVDNFAVIAPPSYWCNPNRNPRGLFTSRLAVNGIVSQGATITLASNEFAVKFEAAFGWKPCNVF